MIRKLSRCRDVSRRAIILGLVHGWCVFLTVAESAEVPGRNTDWRADYAMAPGFHVERDTTGYHFPTAIAFVPEPGPGPKDPLYFVTEIRGALKVVTNDRTVYTFAEDFFELKPKRELPEELGEVGMAGVCLDPETGYVFVSFVYADDRKVYRNSIVRFETIPGTFAIKPTGQTRLAPVFEGFETSVSHQIGPMVIHERLLYVSVGDGEVVKNSRNLDTTNGKLLRMTLDGLPAPGNPFAVDGDPKKARNYIWAYGLRNPFSLAMVQGRIFVADNGPAIDRFVEIHRGGDYMYTGSDASMSANALFLWAPAVSPVQMDYDLGGAKSAGFPEEWRGKFYLALSGSPTHPPGLRPIDARTVATVDFDFDRGRIRETPRVLMRYVGDNKQLPVGLAFGHDGLYVVPLLPDSEGVSAVMRITYDPAKGHEYALDEGVAAIPTTIARYGCLSCHTIDGKGFGGIGPSIIREDLAGMLAARLNTSQYEAQLDAIDRLQGPVFQSTAAAREAVRNSKGTERLRVWLTNRLLEPRFDQEVNAMPNVGMSEEEARQLADWLLKPGLGDSLMTSTIKYRLKAILPRPTDRNMLILFVVGGMIGLLSSMAFWLLMRKRDKRKGT